MQLRGDNPSNQERLGIGKSGKVINSSDHAAIILFYSERSPFLSCPFFSYLSLFFLLPPIEPLFPSAPSAPPIFLVTPIRPPRPLRPVAFSLLANTFARR